MKLDRLTILLFILRNIYIFAYLISNFIAPDLITLFGLTFSKGVFLYPLTFLITDVVGEVYSWKTVKNFYYWGIACSIMIFGLHYIVTDAGTVYLKIVAASLLAYSISQFMDIKIFYKLKQKHGTRLLWFRNNVSTVTSQSVDTAIFVGLLFADQFILVFFSQLIIKVLIALVDTPLCYLGVKILRKKKD